MDHFFRDEVREDFQSENFHEKVQKIELSPFRSPQRSHEMDQRLLQTANQTLLLPNENIFLNKKVNFRYFFN